MNRRERAYVRQSSFHWARGYLDRQRLPAGVPKIINDYVNQLTDVPPNDQVLAFLLWPYRKPYIGL